MKVKCKHHKRRVLFFTKDNKQIVLHREDGSRCDTNKFIYEAKITSPEVKLLMDIFAVPNRTENE